MNANKQYAKACLERLVPELVGLTITGGAVDGTGEFWGFVAEGRKNGQQVRKVVFVLADPEGNGPGFLEIAEQPRKPARSGRAPRHAAAAAKGGVPCPRQ